VHKWLAAVVGFDLACPLYLLGCKCDLDQKVPE
jgi:hypothetical protein